MHAVDLIASAIGIATFGAEGGETGICCVTGEVTECIPRDLLLGRSFTAQALLRAPGSNRLGMKAATTLRHKPARNSSWWCDGESFIPLRRVNVREMVLRPRLAPAWAGYATTSYKKHGALLAPVNTGTRAMWLFETSIVDCQPGATVEAWARLREMQDAGWPRPVLEDLDPSPWLLAKLDSRAWMRFESWARPRMLSPLYRFLCYLLPSKNELEGAERVAI